MDVTLSTFTLEGVSHVLVILRDITERKRTEEALLKAKTSMIVSYQYSSGRLYPAQYSERRICV